MRRGGEEKEEEEGGGGGVRRGDTRAPHLPSFRPSFVFNCLLMRWPCVACEGYSDSASHPSLQFRRRRPNFPKTAVAELRRAFAGNKYPDAEDKARLAVVTQLSVDQISNWFVNARGRDAGKM